MPGEGSEPRRELRSLLLFARADPTGSSHSGHRHFGLVVRNARSSCEIAVPGEGSEPSISACPRTSPGGLAGHSAALIGNRGGTRDVRRRRLRLVLGHAEIEGSEPSPGTVVSCEERASRATSPKRQCPTGDEPGGPRERAAASERGLARAPLSRWFGALPGHVLTQPRAPASGPRENCRSGLQMRRVARSDRSERARLDVVRSPPRALSFHARSERRERRVRNDSARPATNPEVLVSERQRANEGSRELSD